MLDEPVDIGHQCCSKIAEEHHIEQQDCIQVGMYLQLCILSCVQLPLPKL